MKPKLLILLLTFFLFSVGCSEKDNPVILPDEEGGTVTQKDPDYYAPASVSSIDKDAQITPSSASASEHQNGTDIDKTLDGDKGTNYHSRWGNQTEYPVDLIYNFEKDIDEIDYFVLYPRSDGNNNGAILQLTIYTKTQGESEFVKFNEYEFNNGMTPKIISFPEGFKNPESIKLSVTKGINDFVSLAEIEFYKKSAALEASLGVFSDKACTQLKPGVTKDDILAIENVFIKTMALAIFNNVYDEFRIGDFKSYPDPGIIAKTNKTSTYGIYDNVTGIYIKRGSEMVVFMDDFEGEISLRVVNHNEGFGGVDYVMQPGLNRFKVNTEGLAYLMYQDENEYQVRANFATGTINGYFDVAKHTNDDWKDLITNAEYSYFDVLGEFAHLSFTTDDLRQHTTDIIELIGLYDDIVDLEQDFLGLYKYNRANKTRMYFRTNTHQDMYMYATSYRTEYSKGTMPALCNPSTLKASPWGPAHEVGHVNQTRPGLRWLGLTEVTTNIYSLYVQTTWGNEARIDAEQLNPYNNRYEKAFTEILANNLPHGEHGDVFCKLVPFWQLQLYFSNVLGNEDFYKDVHERIRVSDNPSSHGAAQVEFAKICSDIAETDLTEFFIDWGFLKAVNADLDDYGQGTINVTQSMVDDAISYIKNKGYPEPEMKLQFLHEQSLNTFKNKGTLSVGKAYVSNTKVTISGTNNAAVYQQERDGNIIHISPRATFTVANFESNDKIFAVGYDGERIELSVN